MLKKIRKHNKWLMAGFGVLLMVTWLVQPAMNQLGAAVQNRTIAKLDGQKITAGEMSIASKELIAVSSIMPGMVENYFGIRERDTTHWLLLTREAENAGFVGNAADGEGWSDMLALMIAQSEAQRQFGQFASQIMNNQQFFQPMVDRARQSLPAILDRIGSNALLSREGVFKALARARGIYRLVDTYRSAARMSDRGTTTEAVRLLEAAKIDYVFVPAERLIDTVPAPDAAALQAHFDKFKATKPGEGDYGVGYLLPPRVKIEWLKLDRPAIEAAVPLDAVEVRKRYNQFHGTGEGKKYTKDFAEERANVERDMKAEVVEKIMQDAQIAIQTEVGKATKNLEADGRYKKLPADWDTKRPRFDVIAKAVVDAVKKSSGVTIPLPEVTSKGAEWLTKAELRNQPGIGFSQLRQGGLPSIGFDEVIFWARELPRPAGEEGGPIPVQVNLPLAEIYFTDGASRYYVCILDTKGESAPDSIEEKKDQIVKDYKQITVFEGLKDRAEELRAKAVAGGLDAVIAAFPAVEAPKPEKPDAPPPTDPKYKPLTVSKDVVVFKDSMSDRSPNLSVEDVYKQVLATAAKIDPLTPREKVPAETATLSIPIAKHLGLAVIRVLNPEPVTKEKLRAVDAALIQQVQMTEFEDVKAAEQFPFSMANLLKRHKYTSGEKEIKTVEDLKKSDEKGAK